MICFLLHVSLMKFLLFVARFLIKLSIHVLCLRGFIFFSSTYFISMFVYIFQMLSRSPGEKIYLGNIAICVCLNTSFSNTELLSRKTLFLLYSCNFNPVSFSHLVQFEQRSDQLLLISEAYLLVM